MSSRLLSVRNSSQLIVSYWAAPSGEGGRCPGHAEQLNTARYEQDQRHAAEEPEHGMSAENRNALREGWFAEHDEL